MHTKGCKSEFQCRGVVVGWSCGVWVGLREMDGWLDVSRRMGPVRCGLRVRQENTTVLGWTRGRKRKVPPYTMRVSCRSATGADIFWTS